MIHHVSLEIDEKLKAQEWQFWGILGFYPTRPPSRTAASRQHWLIHGDGSAIQLCPDAQPVIPLCGHIAVVEEDFHRTTERLASFGYKVFYMDYFLGAYRAYVISPSGHGVELLSKSVSVKAGPPADTEREGPHYERQTS